MRGSSDARIMSSTSPLAMDIRRANLRKCSAYSPYDAALQRFREECLLNGVGTLEVRSIVHSEVVYITLVWNVHIESMPTPIRAASNQLQQLDPKPPLQEEHHPEPAHHHRQHARQSTSRVLLLLCALTCPPFFVTHDFFLFL